MNVLLGGVGGNPQDLGIKTSKTLFAPRLGLVYRINEDTVFRTGYGITYNPLPWARPMRGFYPLTIASNNVQPEPVPPRSACSARAFRRSPTSGPEHRPRVPAADVDMRTPEPDNVERGRIQSWNVAFERRLPLDVSIDLAYVGTRGDNGYADLDINASDTPGGGNASRPLAAQWGRVRDLKSWGSRLSTEYHSLQMAINRPFKGGLLLKGAYTFSKAFNMSNNDEDGWTRRGLQRAEPVSTATGRWRASIVRTCSSSASSTNCRSARVKAAASPSQLVRDWQLNGVVAAFSGQPFTIRADGTSDQHAGQPPDGAIRSATSR